MEQQDEIKSKMPMYGLCNKTEIIGEKKIAQLQFGTEIK